MVKYKERLLASNTDNLGQDLLQVQQDIEDYMRSLGPLYLLIFF